MDRSQIKKCKDLLSPARRTMDVTVTLVFTPTISKASPLRTPFVGMKLPSFVLLSALLWVQRMSNLSHVAICENPSPLKRVFLHLWNLPIYMPVFSNCILICQMLIFGTLIL